MNNNRLIHQEGRLLSLLAETFTRHGIECNVDENILLFPKQRMTSYVRLFDRSSTSTFVIQLDINLEIGLGKEIIESCVGIGMEEDIAVNDSFNNFLKNSFHTLLAAFFTDEYDDQINRYKWNVNGLKFDVVMSQIGTRGQLPTPLPLEWLDQLDEMVKNQSLTPGIHWIRLYYAQSQRESITTEILLDNEVWSDVEDSVHSFNFPKSSDFLSVRVFLVLKSRTDVSQAAAALAWMFDHEIEDIEKQLVQDGMSALDAEKAGIFIPLAFGRVFLKSMTTASFSDKAIISNQQEEEFEIDLNNEYLYSEAYKLAEYIMENGCINKKHFQSIFLQSSELSAYNNALNEGAKPEDLNNSSFGPPMIFITNYTKEGITTGIEQDTQKDNIKADQPKKSGWKFWKK